MVCSEYNLIVYDAIRHLTRCVANHTGEARAHCVVSSIPSSCPSANQTCWSDYVSRISPNLTSLVAGACLQNINSEACFNLMAWGGATYESISGLFGDASKTPDNGWLFDHRGKEVVCRSRDVCAESDDGFDTQSLVIE
jgi:hypothetical protein